MARPVKPYSRRGVKSYVRDVEYLSRLRTAIWGDNELETQDAAAAIGLIDQLMTSLRKLATTGDTSKQA